LRLKRPSSRYTRHVPCPRPPKLDEAGPTDQIRPDRIKTIARVPEASGLRETVKQLRAQPRACQADIAHGKHARIVGAEWWCQKRGLTEDIGFHHDKDEGQASKPKPVQCGTSTCRDALPARLCLSWSCPRERLTPSVPFLVRPCVAEDDNEVPGRDSRP
jgi:hypothetical protein